MFREVEVDGVLNGDDTTEEEPILVEVNGCGVNAEHWPIAATASTANVLVEICILIVVLVVPLVITL